MTKDWRRIEQELQDFFKAESVGEVRFTEGDVRLSVADGSSCNDCGGPINAGSLKFHCSCCTARSSYSVDVVSLTALARRLAEL